MSELVPFNHLPIEGENDTLHPISGSGASLRGFIQKLSPEAQSDRLVAVDSSLSIALALQQAEETHQFSVLESVQSANMRMEELKREQEQLEL
ncbi:unnamed protein product [Prunus armeniaca]